MASPTGIEPESSESPATDNPAQKWGHIKSFVQHRAHVTPRQKNALDNYFDKWVLPYEPALLDPQKVFGRKAPMILEIGFGMGETTAYIAQHRPEHDFLALEVFTAGVGALLDRIETQDLSNIRIMQHDAVDVVNHMLADGSLHGVHIYFPDPWPKKRHHKRRLIQPDFISKLCPKLETGGYIHCATDWEDYANQMLEVLSGEPSLQNTGDGFVPTPDYRPETKFERRGIRLGHGIWDLIFLKSFE